MKKVLFSFAFVIAIVGAFAFNTASPSTYFDTATRYEQILDDDQLPVDCVAITCSDQTGLACSTSGYLIYSTDNGTTCSNLETTFKFRP